VLTGGKVAFTQTDAGLNVTRIGNSNLVDTIVVLTLASPANEIEPIATPLAGKN